MLLMNAFWRHQNSPKAWTSKQPGGLKDNPKITKQIQISSEKTEAGRFLRLYRDAMASPYAPADLIAIISPRFVSGSSIYLANVSDDSQTGPTTSYL